VEGCIAFCAYIQQPPDTRDICLQALGSWLRCMLHCMLLYQPPRVVTYAYKPGQLATLYAALPAAVPATQVVTYAYKPGQL
jgi:hypothetical protein